MINAPYCSEHTFSSIQALEALVRLEGNDKLRSGSGNLSQEIAKGYVVEDFTVDRGEYRTVIIISLAPTKVLRTCKDCGKEITEGYCINGGEEYFCNDHEPVYFLDLYHYSEDTEAFDTYWTQWED
tara:strand:+ start:333 stop:710 length:378 start_codon:yes stop_codon:yes gene_type:complete